MRFACPCCGYKSLNIKPPGTFEICEVCYWQDDPIQYNDPDFEGGANKVSLRQAQKLFEINMGMPSEPAFEYEGPKDIKDIRRMPLVEIARIFYALDLPINKILGLYLGFTQISDSKFVFDFQEIYSFMDEDRELIIRYIMIKRRKDPNEFFSIYKEIHDLSDVDAQNELVSIEEIFTRKVMEYLNI